MYYDAQINPWLWTSADYQFIDHSSYDRDRGPVAVLGARIHAQF